MCIYKKVVNLPPPFISSGYNKWRDQQPPTAILARQCREFGLNPPRYESNYNRVTIGGKTFYEHADMEDETGEREAFVPP